MIPEVHFAAEQELAAAMRAGEEIAVGAGAEVLAEARRIVELLCDLPNLGTILDDQYRRFPLARFPYAIIYRVVGDRLQVVAVAHRRQHPAYWKGRRW